MAMPVVIAKNQTVSDIDLSRLGQRVPASGQKNLTEDATYTECTEDESLEAAVSAGDIVINDGTNDLSLAEGLVYLNSAGNLDGPATGSVVNAVLKLSDGTGTKTETTGVLIDASDNLTVPGTLDAGGLELSGAPFAHTDLAGASLAWTASGHTGTASRIPSFDGGGAAAEVQIGVDLQAYDADLASLAGLATTGILVRNGAGTAVTRSIVQPAAGITVTNGDGVSGNPTLALADDLAALEGMAGTGLVARTAANTYAQRTLTGTAGRLTVSNGDGVSGNPTLDVGANVILTTTGLGGDLGGNLPNPTVTDLTITGEVQGSVLYYDGTNWVQLPPGTSGEFLQTQGVGANPLWVASSATDELVGVSANDTTPGYLADKLVTATAGVSFVEVNDGGDEDYRLDIVSSSETSQGLIELATQGEVDAGTDILRAVTPATLASATTVIKPSDTAGGDLSGTYPNPTVTDLTITGEVQGSVLYYNGTNWVQLAPGTSGEFLSTQGTGANPLWAAGVESINDLTDVDTATQAPTAGDFLAWDGTSDWVPFKNNETTTDPTVSNDNTEDYVVGSRWINTTDDNVWICVDNSTGAAVWLPLAGSGTLNQYFDGYDGAGGTNVTSGWTDVPLNTERQKDALYTHTNPSAEVTVGETDLYLVIARVTTDQSAGNSRTESEMRIAVNGSPIAGTNAAMYNRNLAQTRGTGTVAAVLSLTASDVVKVQAQRHSGGGTILLSAEGSSLTLIRIGIGGQATGGGSGGSVAVEDEGVSVITELATLNFVGGGVTATDAGGNEATITIPGATFNSERHLFYADMLDSPFTADWAVGGATSFAPSQRDTTNSGLVVRAFDDTTEEGVGFHLRIPPGATNITFRTTGKAAAAPGAAANVGLNLYTRAIPNNAAVGAWSGTVALTTLAIPTNTNFQEDTDTRTLASLALTAGNLYQFEITRNPGVGSDLTGDWLLLELAVEFD